ncbi:hypothetical protein L596_008275 [Steinernema carpocapsae]|uniref:Uncharacterized protein n=1 Tax=Steinernema carpocapsae TaxID=34508 RepID=A0A4U5PBZ7_STECR|nr:hypothetical protein L596_008275 [Steinernema carpocapsae]
MLPQLLSCDWNESPVYLVENPHFEPRRIAEEDFACFAAFFPNLAYTPPNPLHVHGQFPLLFPRLDLPISAAAGVIVSSRRLGFSAS